MSKLLDKAAQTRARILFSLESSSFHFQAGRAGKKRKIDDQNTWKRFTDGARMGVEQGYLGAVEVEVIVE